MARGSNLNTVKVDLNDNSDFTETLEYQVLHCNNFSGNNNKFYCIEIQKNPKTGHLRLFSHYGRLGKTNTYEIRDTWKKGNTAVTEGEKLNIEDEYRAIIAKKESGKTVDRNGSSIREYYTLVDVLNPKVGSLNIRNKGTVNIKQMAPIIEAGSDPVITRLLNELRINNIHEITTRTSFKFTSSGIETDIGPVSEQHILKAKRTLDQLGVLIKANQDLVEQNNQYFSLIPHKFHGALKAEDMISTADSLSKEQDLMDDLLSAIQLGLSKDDGVNQEKLKLNLRVMEKNDQWKSIYRRFNETRHRSHSALSKWKINKIFEVDEKEGKIADYLTIKERLGNEMHFFHGSRNTNILSILLNGLMVPPKSAGFVTGRMFGDGIYGAECSTKALNYATGYWGGNTKMDKVYVFVTKFAMGKIQKCKRSQPQGASKGYDSVHGLSAENGGELLNDEFIVYDTRQAIITHLIELTL